MTYFEQLPSRDDIPRDTLDDRETRNRLLPSKATALTFTMSLKDYHKTFIGRLSFHGVEEEVRDICERMCDILHEEYPLVIRDSSWYYNRNNVEKYDMG
jgi:thymidylate synthase ThyX